jgi:hypothetical protein
MSPTVSNPIDFVSAAVTPAPAVAPVTESSEAMFRTWSVGVGLVASVDGATFAAPVPITVAATRVLAALAGATDKRPAPSAVTATSAMRLRSVFVDMFFLSLVETGHFPISARRSFDPLIPFLL